MQVYATRNVLRSPATLLAVVTVLKIAGFLCLVSAGYRSVFVGDNATDHYLPIANRLLNEGRFNGPDSRADSKVPIGYPAVLALVKGTGAPHDLVLVVCLQMAVDLVVGLLLVALGTALDLRRAGVLAGLAWLLYPPAIIISTWITSETFFTCLLLAALVLLTVAIQRQSLRWTLGAGVLLGVATLFRGTCILLPLALVPLWFSRSLPRGWLHGLVFAVGMGSVVAPWTIRNYVVLDDRIPVAVGFGSVFLQGSHEDVFTIEGKRTHYARMAAEAEAAGAVRPIADRESQRDSWLMRVGINNYQRRLAENPWSLISFAGVKMARIWYGTEGGSHTTQLGLLLCSVAVVPLAVWRFVAWRRTRTPVSLLFGFTLLYFVALHVVTLPEYRYMHPLFPVLLFGAMATVFPGARAETQPTE